MSITEQYWVASTARSKLSKAAAQTEHNLRLLVGHANLLDSESPFQQCDETSWVTHSRSYGGAERAQTAEFSD